ncbi:hypothetical protein NADFUDRAFT_68636 [Nadsonia fulvescens var. elongata DSM 6958]|uniref:Uncharacterized protein n=1 Tax=Nadsonia fulvescens var. elongata DSM 6958 TaxID=857566 RepID=A0A1E3PSM0_9ASCO|nr:hypothetical protein NADFUDRAFT_68636 [Nadsonia fulvescens var. elongata DSM 6958]
MPSKFIWVCFLPNELMFSDSPAGYTGLLLPKGVFFKQKIIFNISSLKFLDYMP